VEFLKAIELTPDLPPQKIKKLSEIAESSGFDTIFTSCHYNNRDSLLTLAHIANSTDSIRIGPGIMNPYTTHPLTLASQMATLWELSDGRAILGIGAGDRSTLSHFGLKHTQTLLHLSKTIELLRSLWGGEQVNYEGPLTNLTTHNARLNFTIGHLPIYIGTQGNNILKLSTEIADGTLFNNAHFQDLSIAMEYANDCIALSERKPGTFDFSAHTCISVDLDAHKAKNASRPSVAFIVAGASSKLLQSHDIDLSIADSIQNLIKKGSLQQAFDKVTDNMINTFSISGTPDTVSLKIEEIYQHTGSIVVGYPLGPDPEFAISTIGSILE
tara:strand:- start:7212 stop:8195 length:984 start_codon:yes stop_codon:yes gene_type:complete